MQTQEKIAAAVLSEPLAENTTTGIGHDAITEEDLRDRAEVSRSLATPEDVGHEDSKPAKPARRRSQKKVSITSDATQPPATVGEVASQDAASAGAPANPPSAGADLEDNAPQAPVALDRGSEESTILDRTTEPASAEALQNTAVTNVQPDRPAEEVGLEITIDPEFQKLCPPLSEEAYQLLRAEIERDGQFSPLAIWVKDGKKILLDGHNRHKILQELNRVPLTVEVQLENREDAVEWVIRNQFARRNLGPRASKLLRGMLYNERKGRHGGARQASDQSEHLDSIAAQIGKETGVSPATVRRDARLAEAAEKLGVTQEMMAGTEKRSAKEIVATAFPSDQEECDVAPVAPASPEQGEYQQSPIYPKIQKAVRILRGIDWDNTAPNIVASAKADIEQALPSRAADATPAVAPTAAKKKRTKTADNNPAQLQLGLTDSQATDVQSINE